MARVFARLLHDKATIAELLHERSDITREFHPEFLRTLCVEVTGRTPMPEVGWVKQQDGSSFAAPAPFAPSPDQLLRVALAAGVKIVSAATPALTGTWGIMQHDEISLIAAGNGAWSGGYRDKGAVRHTMSADDYARLRAAILQYIVALDEAHAAAAAGAAWSPPASPVAIA